MTIKYPTEDKEQMDLAEYLNHRFGYFGWVHVPNQRWAKVQYLRKLAKMGVKKGFPDILIFERATYRDEVINGVFYHGKDIGDFRFVGMAIELKRQKGAKPITSREQNNWLKALEQKGWAAVVAYGVQDAINKIEEVYVK